ncbi:MAG: TIGR02594 family protein [Chelatococcus sp.]|nr:MAG: TIGR02594 family protein [Chelatococcus sp.]
MSIIEIQRALAAAGNDPGPIDGAWGRRSIAACKAYQRANGLVPDGIPGPKTLAKLFSSASVGTVGAATPIWFREARRLIGVRETPGTANNPVILGWAKKLGGWIASYFTADSIPWCGLFVGHVVAQTLPSETLPANALGAKNWATFGRKLTAPAIGAVMVFTRTGGGHVGFYAGEDSEAYHILGGNQSDAVTIARVAKSRCIAMRWPATAANPVGGRVYRALAGTLSVNEA